MNFPIRNKCLIDAPSLDVILSKNFDYSNYVAQHINASKYVSAGVDPYNNYDSVRGTKKDPMFTKLTKDLNKKYGDFMILLQNKFEYNYVLNNPNLDKLNDVITKAMKIISVIYLECSDLLYYFYGYDLKTNYEMEVKINKLVKDIDRGSIYDLSISQDNNVNMSFDTYENIYVSIPDVVRDFARYIEEIYNCLENVSEVRDSEILEVENIPSVKRINQFLNGEILLENLKLKDVCYMKNSKNEKKFVLQVFNNVFSGKNAKKAYEFGIDQKSLGELREMFCSESNARVKK